VATAIVFEYSSYSSSSFTSSFNKERERKKKRGKKKRGGEFVMNFGFKKMRSLDFGLSLEREREREKKREKKRERKNWRHFPSLSKEREREKRDTMIKMIQMIMRRRPHLYTQSRVSQKQPL